MAPPPNQPNHLRRCSKAQTCFFKILHIISVFNATDASDTKCSSHNEEIRENKRFDVDLNICLRPATEVERFEPLVKENDVDFDENCVLEKNDPCKIEPVVADESESTVEEERCTEHSEISHVGDHSSGIDCNGGSEVVLEQKHRDEGYLGLLIEAAQLILGENGSEPNRKPPSRETEPPVNKRKPQCWTAAAQAEWYAEFEDTSPVVKSKRGRNQVLPYKYRDSVLEPYATTSFRHRSNSNAPVRSKRRSKQ